MKYLQKLEQLDVENDQEFEYQYREYTRDTKLRDLLNKIFTANIKHVFSCNVIKNKNSVDFGGTSFILVNNRGKFVFATSSEWANIDLI